MINPHNFPGTDQQSAIKIRPLSVPFLFHTSGESHCSAVQNKVPSTPEAYKPIYTSHFLNMKVAPFAVGKDYDDFSRILLNQKCSQVCQELRSIKSLNFKLPNNSKTSFVHRCFCDYSQRCKQRKT